MIEVGDVIWFGTRTYEVTRITARNSKHGLVWCEFIYYPSPSSDPPFEPKERKYHVCLDEEKITPYQKESWNDLDSFINNFAGGEVCEI